MTRTLLDRLIRLARWPRRVAAVACLALAAVSALSARSAQSSARAEKPRPPASLTSRLSAGQLAVPVTISDASAANYLHAGDRVDLFAGPADVPTARPVEAAPIGERLLVLAVAAGTDASDATVGAHLMVAADRSLATKIAGLTGRPILAVLDKYP
jgi:hypothetical protein